MSTLTQIRGLLRQALQIGDRADRLEADSPLLGGIPEFDSMAVVTVVTMLEDEFGLSVSDDELTAEVFSTVGALSQFVDNKLRI